MRLSTRKLLDHSFSGLGFFSILLMCLSLLVLLGPIVVNGLGAVFFRETVEHRRFLYEALNRGDREKIEAELKTALEARMPVYRFLDEYEKEIMKDAPPPPPRMTPEEEDALSRDEKRERRLLNKTHREFQDLHKEELESLFAIRKAIQELLGPHPDEVRLPLIQTDYITIERYGQTRWKGAKTKIDRILYSEEYDHGDGSGFGKKVKVDRGVEFKSTALEPLFPYVRERAKDMLLPRPTVYLGFLYDKSFDVHMLGGIWPAILGTIYLTLGAMLIAAPLGVIAAVYFVEYAGNSRFVSFLRVCVSTLAGVPSIVFGLFGLAFLINTVKISSDKSVLAGAVTLALLILPTVIRAAEEAIKSVPQTYREAAIGLGASRWHTVVTVVLPAAMGGILTGTIISMGRAAGETAPIIFTAAVSLGKPIRLWEVFTQPTQALPWSIYNLSTEHARVDEIRHTQYGMVLTLILVVLSLNLAAIWLRARISKKLKG
jgi:phosphate transport system permease protein